MEDDREEQEGLTADELVALLGLAAANAGGKLQLKLDGLKALDGKGIGIAIDEAAGTATVELLDATRTEGEPKIEPTHPASITRH